MSNEEIAALKTLLIRMQANDPAFRVFGSKQHRYQLGPTLSESELESFERKNQIRLPEDYRRFLQEAGNGGTTRDSRVFMGNSGAGPCYGLVSLDDAAADSDLRRPFPFTESTDKLPEDDVARWIDPDNFPGIPGGLALCHAGCGIMWFLIVNGPTYGTMWEGREDYYPTGLTFGDWYRRWTQRLVKRALPVLAQACMPQR
jgi:hypothetical protein